MNREDIIRMAREATKEAPREDWNSTAWVFGDETLEHFAALVASVEREQLTDAAMKAAEKAVNVAIALEREECAKVCDGWLHADGDQCAEAIRARGQA